MKKEDFPLSEQDIENAHRVAYLIAGYIRQTLTPAEHRELDDWVADSDRNMALFEELTDEDNLQQAMEWFKTMNTEKSLQRLKSRMHHQAPKRLWSILVAASILGAMAVGSYLFIRTTRPGTPPAAAKTEISTPPKGKVLLTLDNGQTLALDSATNGRLAAVNNATVVKQDGSLTYEPSEKASVYHTLATGAGSQYRLTLPDGTQVWLNAQSSLRFPTAFAGSERRVELTGEGYFEVAKDATRPFLVQSGGATVQVLGTHFNVRSYAGEDGVSCTLLEGSVQVSNPALSQVLKPGQQALVRKETIELALADTDEALSWKSGKFVFHQSPITAVLNELERWYGVAFENKEETSKHLTATFSRSLPLPTVLRLLEATGDVQFRTEGKLIKVVR